MIVDEKDDWVIKERRLYGLQSGNLVNINTIYELFPVESDKDESTFFISLVEARLYRQLLIDREGKAEHTGKPVGVLPRTGEKFYFHPKDENWPADYVYENGHSLTVMDYTDALRVAGCYPNEYKEV